MKYNEFRSLFAKYPFFRSNSFDMKVDNPKLLRNQLIEWVKKGYVIELKRGVYTLNPRDREVGLTELSLASILYSPSYISLEYALSFYQLIPERAVGITSISTKKTQSFENKLGYFTYRHVQKKCFQGFVQKEDEFKNSYFIASPEKALVDYLYFYLRGLSQSLEPKWFEESLRLQNVETLDIKRIRYFTDFFQQKKLMSVIKLFEEYYA